MSSGSITEMGTKYIIKGICEFNSLDDIKNVIVAYKSPLVDPADKQPSIINDRVPVFLKDVASIHYENKTPENSKPPIFLNKEME